MSKPIYRWEQSYELDDIHWALCDTESDKGNRVTDHHMVLYHHWPKCCDGKPLSEQAVPKRIVELLNRYGMIDDRDADREKNIIQELLPYLEAAMPEISTPPFPGPDAQLDCDDMNLASMCDLYHRAKKAIE